LTLLLSIGGVVLSGKADAPDRRPIPDPPEQAVPWTAPETKLPGFLVSATGDLFSQGVADPRGCEYREVVPDPPTRWLASKPARVHAFVLPAVDGDDRRFAVGWNGILTRVKEVGPDADLAADVNARADALRKGRDEGVGNRFQQPGTQFWRFVPKEKDREAETVLPIQVCLLLRLGRADLAEQLFAGATPWKPDGLKPDLTDYGVSYLSLAREWANELYVRGVAAHGRGDDGLALDTFRRVASFCKQAEAKAAAMGFTPQRNPPLRAEAPAFFPNLTQLDALLADQERRAAEPPRGPIPGKNADPDARVAALILNLDQIAEHQMSVPGGASPGGSELVSELVAIGDPAVEPLLRALVEDTRLTRSISYGRGMDQYRFVSPTVDAIVPALGRLMKSEVPGLQEVKQDHPDGAARRAMAAAYRRFWEANRNVPLVERDYRILADDAKSSRWQMAANGLSSPAPDSSGRFRYPAPGQPPLPFLGEPLRDKREPSVTALMIRRAEELAKRGGDGLLSACGIATALSRWDPPAALPLLRTLMDRAIDQFAALSGNSLTNRSLVETISRFTLLRTRAGDREALDAYAAWIRTMTPESLGKDTWREAFEPMWIERDHPAIIEASRALFTDPKSPWLPLSAGNRHVVGFNRDRLETSPLIRVPAFREAVFEALSDKTPNGVMKRSAEHPDQLSFEIKGGTSGGFRSQDMADLEKLPLDEERPVRVCDWLALLLSSLDGTPRFEMAWPEPKRDEAVTAIAAFLRRYGDNYEVTTSVEPAHPFENFPRLGFPRLDRPATPADVEAARAIFSLEGLGGEARVVPLPEVPLSAAWTTLEDTPVVSRQTTPDGKTKTIHSFNRSINVWQAEEVREEDRWTRYFGFVSSGRVGRAPAEEVEFREGPYYGFERPINPVGVRLSFVDPPKTLPNEFPPGGPSLVAVRLRNHLGLDQTVPTEFIRPGPDGKPALRPGVTIKLTRVDLPPALRRDGFEKPPPPEELKPTRDARFTPGDATRTLGPAETFEAFRIDLRDWFDLSRPGQYRAQVEFGDGSGIARADVGELYFRVSD